MVTIGLEEKIRMELKNDVFAVNLQFSHPDPGEDFFYSFRKSLFFIA